MMRFAVGEFRLERVTSSSDGAPAASATDEGADAGRCELQLLGDEACLLNEGEGQLEEDECASNGDQTRDYVPPWLARSVP